MTANVDLHSIQAVAGDVDLPGAPILHLHLLVHPMTGRITGQASVTQAIAPPGGTINIHNVTGQVRKLGLDHGPITQLVVLEGTYVPIGARSMELATQLPFRAHFATDARWNGRGGFEYGGRDIEDVPLQHRAPRPPIQVS